jgi:hypothetical protein
MQLLRLSNWIHAQSSDDACDSYFEYLFMFMESQKNV